MIAAMGDPFLAYMATEYVPIAGAEAQPAEAEAEAPAEGEETPAPSVDLGPLMERMDEVRDRQAAFEERLTAADQGQQQQAPEDEFGFGQQPEYDPNQVDPSQLDPNDPQAALQLLRQEAQRAAQEALQPEIQRQTQERIQAEGEQLLEDYPELQQREAAQSLTADAQQWAQDIFRRNPEYAQLAVGEPAFLELVHLAAKTAERAEQETPAGQAQAEVTLEAGGAPNQGAEQPQANLGERIQRAGKRRGLPPAPAFWGQ